MRFENVTCPHCGLLCDDLVIETNDLNVTLVDQANPCSSYFTNASITSNELPSPLVDGEPCTQQEALERAAELLSNAKLPLVNGLIADVQACREAIALTEKLGGVIDHANGSGMRKSTAVMQRIGEVKTTLAEVKNRADCIIIFGANVTNKFPRLVQRILKPTKTLGLESSINKKIFILDVAKEGVMQVKSEENITHLKLNYPLLESIIYRFQEVVTRPKEYFIEHNSENDAEHDQDTKHLFTILNTILTSHYTTLIWDSSNFNRNSAEHTIQALTESIKTLMQQVRCVGLPLSGSKGEITANQVATWLTSVPLPISFMNGIPEYKPAIYDGAKMLANREADCLLWISTYNREDVPPKSNIPTIVVGHPNMECEVDVYLPVGVPGIDHRGLACRTDSVATLPLHKVRDSKLLSADMLLKEITTLI